MSHPPTVFIPDVLFADEGRRSVTTLRAIDLDQDPLTFYAERIPPFRIDTFASHLRDLARLELVSRGDGTADLVFVPRHNEAGHHPLRVAVFDGAGNFNARDVTLVIEDTQPEGDANCDGRLGPDDVPALVHSLFDSEARVHCATGDTNDDGLVLVNDVIGLVRKIIG